MVVLSVVASDNPYTVFFDESIPAAAQVGLISFTMKNPWLYLRSHGKISVLNDEVQGEKSLSPFFYTPTTLAKYLNDDFKESPAFSVTFDYDPNTGVITLKNPDSLKLKFSPSFVDFLGVPGIVESDATIPNLKARSAMYVHCDLVDPARNLLNGTKIISSCFVSRLQSLFFADDLPFLEQKRFPGCFNEQERSQCHTFCQR